ncbi:hypothetical protein [Rhizobium sp. BR 314]|uniref:hypothetical protein n=1 Tax=Rhizobium sp. BR 314 TaxID=3040013 RepID=UPI0039BF0F32
MAGALESEPFHSLGLLRRSNASLTSNNQSGCSSAFPLTTDVLALLRERMTKGRIAPAFLFFADGVFPKKQGHAIFDLRADRKQ